MGTIIPAIKQWRSLCVSFTDYAPFLWNTALSSLCETASATSHAPQLERLSLVYPLNDDTKEFLLFGNYAPRLRDVTLHGIRLRWTAPLFESLVSLDYTHHGFTAGHEAVQETLMMLTVSRHLKSLSISFPCRGMKDGDVDQFMLLPHAYTPTSLGHLEVLTLRVHGDGVPDELRILTSKLILPSLRCLRLETRSRGIPFSRKAVTSVLKAFRRHERLISISIQDAWVHRRCVSAFLRSLPALQQLSASGPRVTDAFVDNLLMPVRGRYVTVFDLPKRFAIEGLVKLDLLDGFVTISGVRRLRRRVFDPCFTLKIT